MENERQQRFIGLLNQIFELDKSDLDFGIYRILNIRKSEIEDFFKTKLPAEITAILKPFASQGKEDIVKQMDDLKAQLGENIETLPDTIPAVVKYKDLKIQMQQGTDISALESDVYSALYSFFSRYYDEGDFISKRRYKEGVYAIPYEGEEVKLYWANHDQYYIKTSENFKDYTFTTESYTVHFRLVDATTEQNNNKENEDKKRQFMLFTEDEVNYPGIKTFEVDGNELIIRFVYDVPTDQKAKYAELNLTAIRQYLVSADTQLQLELLKIANPDADKKNQVSVIEKHLKGYVAKNTFDYFIHKDLGGFLTRELDFFIKNEIMHLDDLDTQSERRVNTYLAKVRAIKRVGKIIIDFLAQLENFQKKLWLKKKFVVETNWCITLDRIDEQFYDEIRKNKAQIAEWKQMYAIDEIVNDLEHTEPWTEEPSVLFLKQNQNLVVDTKHFSDEFKMRLLASIDNLEEQTGGLMINSDNFHALELLQERYKEGIQSIYVDPPYNTSSSEILYKNNYKHSSWLSLLYDRIKLGKKLLLDEGVQCTAIDDVEESRLKLLLENIFEGETAVVALRVNPHGRLGTNGFSITHDYALFSRINEAYPFGLLLRDERQNARYNERDEKGAFLWFPLQKTGSNTFRKDRPTMFYPIFLNESTGTMRIPKMDYNETKQEYILYEEPSLNEIIVYPIKEDGKEGNWYFGVERAKKEVDEFKSVKQKDGSYTIYVKYRATEGLSPFTIWDDAKYSATEHGTALLKHIFGKQETFSYPKALAAVEDSLRVSKVLSNSYVLDYFAGSATTGHAVINLNRNDKETRRYILVEMGSYFNTVTHPRMKKVIYSPDWKDGKPQSRDKGYSHIMKYMRLESYEDALSNISLEKQSQMQNLFGDEYFLNYMLDLEAKGSLLNTDRFKAPFEYEMKITEKNECKKQRVDVCETFNYLIGLTIQHQGVIRSFNAIPAAKPEYEGAVDLQSNNNGQYQFRQIEGKLPDGRKALIIWRNITDNLLECNAALDAYFLKYRINPQDREYDVIYVNGDSNLENLRMADESWKVIMTETEFNKRMFEE